MDELGNTDDVKQLYYKYMPKHLFDKIEKANAIHGETI